VSDGYAASRIDDLPDLWDGFARLVRAGLDVSAFGCQVMDLPADYTTASHDESDSGQEEVYFALRGSGAVLIDDEDRSFTLDPDHVVRVSAGTARTLTSGPEGMRALIVGGTPGKAYEPPDWTEGG
jgi:mannose-6-phosphate isomerase-like protein (cupin superfamily)